MGRFGIFLENFFCNMCPCAFNPNKKNFLKTANFFNQFKLQKKTIKKGIYFLLFLYIRSAAAENVLEDNAKQAFEMGHYKEAISFYKELITQANSGDRGKWLSQLALAYYRDQDDISTFTTYLEALEQCKPLPNMKISDHEQTFCNEALSIYLDTTSPSPRDSAQKLKQNFTPILSLHPNYYMLNFFVAVAYANMGMFDEFFDRFYQSYQAYPDSFIALKTRGMLHLKLFERLSEEKEREKQRRLALGYLNKAKEKYPRDGSLYKLVILFASMEDKPEIVRQSLKAIVDDNIIIPRYEISYYIQEAIHAKEFDLAEAFLAKAREWYKYSRVIDAAQELLEKKKNKTPTVSFIE